MAESDKPVDEALGALYRGLPQDAPPPALDAAILDAAKRSVAARPARRWAVPVSLAAVLVLSVSVTLHVAEERPEVESAPAAPPVPAAVQAPMASPAPVAVESAPVPEARKPVASLSARREDRAVDRGPAAAAQPAPASPPALVPEPAPAPAPVLASAPPAPQASAERAAPQARSAAAPAATGLAMADRAKRSMEAQQFAPPAAQAPGPWLEAIAQLRAQGRHEDADASLVEFRRRYPEFEISPEMQRRIAPPR